MLYKKYLEYLQAEINRLYKEMNVNLQLTFEEEGACTSAYENEELFQWEKLIDEAEWLAAVALARGCKLEDLEQIFPEDALYRRLDLSWEDLEEGEFQ